MPEDVLFKSERRQSRAEIADTLRAVADKLEAGDPITLSAGGDSLTLEPPANPEFEIKAEREYAAGASQGELSVEFEIEWDEGDDGTDESVTIE